MKKNLNKGCRAQGVRQLEVMLIDLHIRQLQAVINQLKVKRAALLNPHKKKRRRSLWNEQTPLRNLIYLEYESGFKALMTEWGKHTTEIINPYKTYRFIFSSEESHRLIYLALARFLSKDGRQIRVKPMEFYRYLSTHTTLGSVANIKTGLCRARKWLQENEGHKK